MLCNIERVERVHAIFFRAWIALTIAIDVMAIASLFMGEGSTWAVARRFVLLTTIPAIGAYAWLHRRRNLKA
jgi:hypothetical protein